MHARIFGTIVFAATVSFATGPEFAIAKAQPEGRGESTIIRDNRVLKSLAVSGDARLKFQAFMHVYENQPELEQELDVAMTFLRDAAMAGFPEAEYMLGYVLVREEFFEKSIDEGLRWLSKAAAEGHDKAAFWLGMYYLESYYLNANESEKRAAFEEATRSLEKAIESHAEPTAFSSTAQTQLGRLYLAESFRDTRGWELLMSAADAGHEPARKTLRNLNVLLDEYNVTGSPEVMSLRESLAAYLGKTN